MFNIMKKDCSSLVLAGLASLVLLSGIPADAGAAGLFSFGDVEKPKPEFTRNNDQISAKFIPRAKSTSVVITFKVSDGGMLDKVKGVDFYDVKRPEVDVKNFKSAVFAVDINQVKPGTTASLAVESDFFTQGTAFYIYNPKREKSWIREAQTENRGLPRRVRQLIVRAQDGGEYDADGQANGRILLIGGPRDSFWGYALGTLFIRFFGIFLVLSVLMIGMMVSGKIFEALEKRKDRPGRTPLRVVPGSPAPAESAPPSTGVAPPATADIIAVISLALHMHFNRLRARAVTRLDAPASAAWIQQGRQRVMGARCFGVRNRKP